MSGFEIAVIGGGPTATYALERLAAHLCEKPPHVAVHIRIFERNGEFGAGETHSHSQPPTSFLNRVASQIAFAADESNEGAGPLLDEELRPTFHQWSREKFRRTADPRFDLRPDDVPARFLHGMALREQFERYVALLRGIASVSVTLEAAEVLDIEEDVNGPSLAIHWQRGLHKGRCPADRVLMATGPARRCLRPDSPEQMLSRHAEDHPGLRYIDHPYPLQDQLTHSRVPAGCRVALRGQGLTAIDAILYLTEGRSGKFVRAEDGLRYARSGKEPATIVCTSPSGSFTWARPLNEKAADGSGSDHRSKEHKGAFLTLEAVRSLKRNLGRPMRINGEQVLQLDFELEVFPLVVLEMAYVFYATAFGAEAARSMREALHPFCQSFVQRGSICHEAAIAQLLQPLEQSISSWMKARPDVRFDWRPVFEPLADLHDREGMEWQQAAIRFMRRDNASAARGNLSDPLKAACDGVWRDLRSVFAEVVDFGGLTAESQKRFDSVYFRLYTRMSNGTGVAAMQKILALLEDGLLDVSVGPGGVVQSLPGLAAFVVRGPRSSVQREADVVIEGRVPLFDPAAELRPLYRNLLARGTVRRWCNPASKGAGYEPGALDLDRQFHPRNRSGEVDRRLTIIGAPAERLAYFQLSAARPRTNSSVLNNVACWAHECIAALRSLPARGEADAGASREGR